MPHPLVIQLGFARTEFTRGLDSVSDADARQRLLPMNSISWMIGHMAWQEQRYWLWRAQDKILFPELNELLAYGQPASTPPLDDAWRMWRTITQAADAWLDTLTTERLQEPIQKDLPLIGNLLRRTTYHYWYHLGEAMAVRQMLGHPNLPDFVGDIDSLAPYQPE